MLLSIPGEVSEWIALSDITRRFAEKLEGDEAAIWRSMGPQVAGLEIKLRVVDQATLERWRDPAYGNVAIMRDATADMRGAQNVGALKIGDEALWAALERTGLAPLIAIGAWQYNSLDAMARAGFFSRAPEA